MSATNLMTKSLEKEFEKYPLYSQDGKGGDAKVIAKYFNPAGRGTWLITEASKEENGDWTMFGYVHLGDDEMAELGYVMLSDLENLKYPVKIQVGNRTLTSYAEIERDMHMPIDITLKEAIKDCGFKVPDWMLSKEEKQLEEIKGHLKEVGYDLDDEAIKEGITQYGGIGRPDNQDIADCIQNEIERANSFIMGEGEPELDFDSFGFQKRIPLEMRPKQVTRVGEKEVHWVTQEPFNEDDLKEFQDALKKYGGEVERIYVTVRDLSWSYDFEDDKARNVLATVTKDEIIAEDYYHALEADGLGHYLKRSEREQ